MKAKLIKGLSQVQSKYDAFFIDLWGVLHNGIELFSGAVEVLENLNKLNKRFVLMSNAPRPSKSVKKFLLKLKLNRILLKNIFTSGEAALQSLQKNVYGKNFYHLGPKRDNSLFEGFENNRKNPEDADFILCTGFLDNHEDSLNYHKDLLKKYIQLKMICTNPDLVVHRGFEQEYCAGTLAQIFKELGGKVIYFGKPHPEIYLCVANLLDLDPNQCIVFEDSDAARGCLLSGYSDEEALSGMAAESWGLCGQLDCNMWLERVHSASNPSD